MTKESPRGNLPLAQAEKLRAEISAIEHAIDAGAYRPGPWARLLSRARAASCEDRRAISTEITRVSRKLHLRRGRKTVSVRAGVIAEMAAIALGYFLLALGVRGRSNVAAIAGMALWVMAFQPVFKMVTGTALGVRYDYAYLARGEPRFKMHYGSYLARPRWARIILHLSGAVGSPLGAYLAAMLVRERLRAIYTVAMIVFWLVNAVNLAFLVAGLSGIKQLVVSRTSDSSCGAAGAEIREALGC